MYEPGTFNGKYRTLLLTGRSQFIQAVIALLIFVLLSLFFLKSTNQPYIWLSISGFVLSLWIAFSSRDVPFLRLLSINASVFLLAILVSETTLLLTGSDSDSRIEGSYLHNYFVPDDVLGYGPRKDSRVQARRLVGDEIVYDVQYTIDSDGLRTSNSGRHPQAESCFLFFGGSFTFGEGLNDHQTLPFIVADRTGSMVYNFGFHGYGPHQMLASLEFARVDEIIDCVPTFAIYQAMPHHVTRAAGKTSWDKHGPNYEILENGKLQYSGPFDADRTALARNLERFFRKSQLFKTLMPIVANLRNTDEVNRQRFFAIVKNSKKLLTTKYPQLSFHVFLWDDETDIETYRVIRDGLEANVTNIHEVKTILLDSGQPLSEFFIKDDQHPTYPANQVLADYLIQELVPKTTIQ